MQATYPGHQVGSVYTATSLGSQPKGEAAGSCRPGRLSVSAKTSGLERVGRWEIPWYLRPSYHSSMKIGVSLPENLLAFADEEAQRRGTTRSGLLASLLEAEQVQAQVRRYIDKHGWDVADDEGHWRQYQQARMAEEYRDDDW
jgi:hypothetical protein